MIISHRHAPINLVWEVTRRVLTHSDRHSDWIKARTVELQVTSQATTQASRPTLASTLGNVTASMLVTCTEMDAVLLVLVSRASTRGASRAASSSRTLSSLASQAVLQASLARPAVAASCNFGTSSSVSTYVCGYDMKSRCRRREVK